MEKTSLEVLKERYVKIQEKYNLPSFEEMNEEFSIEKAEEEKFDLLIREIRRYVADKMLNYLKFTETLLNPSNAPMFVFSLVKALEAEDKKRLTEIYKKLAKLEIDLIILDLKFLEVKEAEFIRDSFKLWKEISVELLSLVEKVKINWDKDVVKSDKSFVR